MRRNNRFHPYSLLEVLAAIALIAMLTNAVLYLFYNGNRLSRHAAERGQAIKSTAAITQAWRQFVHRAGTPQSCRPERIDFADGSYATREKKNLVFSLAGRGNTFFTLADHTTVEFALENPPGEPPVQVLYLRQLGSKGQTAADKFIRLAAVKAAEVKK